MELDQLIYRHFTTGLLEGQTVYDLFKWKKVDVLLKDFSTGEKLVEMHALEFPEHYSQNACDIIANKYFRKKGVGSNGQETSMRQLAHRMVDFWCTALVAEGILTKDQQPIVYDELVYMLLMQMWAPNSPQWFNTGHKQAYGIAGKAQGHYYFDPEKDAVVRSKDAYTRTQGSACFIVSVADSLVGDHSLTDQLKTETLLFKYGSGVGTNWSPIRGRNEALSGGGKSSGLLSFLKVFDRNAGAIKSGGTTRRAAKMNILDVDHPEIMDYIKWKADEEDKAAALGKMGYSTQFEGEAYDTVSGQNANNSVRFSDDFMQKINQPDAAVHCTGRIDNSADIDITVADIWHETAKAAWRCGDPGVQFDDIINMWHTCPAGQDSQYGKKHNRINASNPCSEYMFLDDTACNLASINIVRFYDQVQGQFDVAGYLHCIKMVQLVLEATIYQGQFPTEDIARNSYLFRTTGLGLTNLGMLFMMMAKPYDSTESRTVAASCMSILTGYSYYISALMAQKVGAFACYEQNQAHMLRVLRNHSRAATSTLDGQFEGLNYQPTAIDHAVLFAQGMDNVSECITKVWQLALTAGERYGYRNAQVSVLAPTGTIAFAMDCATTSSEPFFAHVVYKKLAGGGVMELINPSIEIALKKLGYSDFKIKEIGNYVLRKETSNGQSFVADGKIEGAPHLKEEHLPIFDTASYCGSGVRIIKPDGHVKMMGALSPHVSGAISKTVNLPNESTVADIKAIYKSAWQLGIKAIAIYRDGCKASQPLNAAKESVRQKPLTDYTYLELMALAEAKNSAYKPIRTKPKGIRAARVHEAQIDGLKLYITTSFFEDGRLGEIYVSSGRQGTLVKGLLDSISTTLSEMLQYGVPPEDIARMYRGQKYEPSGFITGHPYIKSVDSISDLISKIIDIELGDYTYCQVKPKQWEKTHAVSDVLKKQYRVVDYIQGEVCPVCKSPKMVKNGTCKVCTDCGTTTGCS